MKLMKKIAPIAASLLMLGATAAAADLGSWKTTFGGADTAIVLGADAATADNIGAINIATALTTITTSTSKQPVANAHLIRSAGDDLNIFESFGAVDDTLDDGDLPTLLAEGQYRDSKVTENDVTYTQKLLFENVLGTTDRIVFAAKDDGNKAADNYLFLDDGAEAYTYRLRFDTAVDYDGTDDTTTKDDFQMTKIKMMGREYTITDAKQTATILDELTLMAGAVKATQQEYSTASYTIGNATYTVEVPIISDTGNTVVLKINGETTDELGEGDTYTLDDDTVVGIVDVVPNEGTEKTTGTAEGNDIVTFYLGAEKMVLKDGQEVEENGETVDGSDVAFTAAANTLTQIDITYTPDEDTYIPVDGNWTDPILGRLKYTFQGMDESTETIAATSGGDDGVIKVLNNADKELEIPVVFDDSVVGVGGDGAAYFGDEIVLAAANTLTVDGVASQGNMAIGNADVCTGAGAGTMTDCEGTKFLLVSAGGEAHIIEISNIDEADNEVTFKDITKGKTYDPMTYLPLAGAETFDLGILTATIDFVEAAKTVTFTTINAYTADNTFQTSLGGDIELNYAVGGVTTLPEASFTLDNNDGELMGGAITFLSDLDATPDLVLDVTDTNLACSKTGAAATSCDLVKDSDYRVAVDDGSTVVANGWSFGTYFKWDTENDDDVTIVYPEEQAIAKAYVSEELTNIPELGTTTTSGSGPTPVEDTDWANAKVKNVIVVGGSGINKAAADLLGLTYPTYGSAEAWQTATGVSGPGIAVVKMMSNPYATGKYAMLVAGWDGVDTQKAALALKEGTPALSGMTAKMKTSTATVELMA